MSFFDPQNPGIGGLKELTDAEALVLSAITALGDPNANTILGWDDTDNSYAYFLLGSGLSYNHSTHTLSVTGSGASAALDNLSSVAINASLLPGTDGVVDLGSATKEWGNLFIKSTGVINFGNSNVVLTHSSGILTMGTGELRVTTVGTNTASVVTVGGTQTLTNKTLTTAVLGSSTATTQTPADNSTKVATTAYVDAAVLGQRYKEACKYATTAALATVIYSNGSSGVGATLIAVGLGAISIDGSTPSVGDRLLIKNQVSTFQNGIYTVTTVGNAGVAFVLTRAVDFNQSSEIQTGDSVFVSSGTANSTTTWAYTGVDSPTMGTDALTWAQAAGQGSFTQGNGITITGVSIAIDTSVVVDKTTSQALTNKTISGLTVSTTTGTFALTSGKTLSVSNTLTLAGTDSTTMTFPSTTATIARTDAAQTFIGTQTFSQVITTANAITASSNAATVPITSKNNIVTNNSAATLTITLTTTSAVNMQPVIVQILDSSAVAQTVSWVNTENSTVSAPTTSNGSTTLPLTVGFIYNSATSKWRCIASA